MKPSSYLSKRMDSSGFSLIELAVVIVIVGIIISIMASVLPSLIKSSKVKKAEAILESVDYALRGCLITSEKLPYADSDKDGNADAEVYFGWLPFRDLGLSSGDDVWGQRLKYGIYDEVGASDLCDITFPASVDISKLHTVSNTDSSLTQQLYVIISGGDVTGLFEARNSSDDAEYDDPRRFVEYNSSGGVVYNDLMIAGEINTLKGIVCSGGGSGGGASGDTVGENAYPNGCSNGDDDDGDGYTDCDDQDCFGVDDDGDAVDDPCGAGGTDVIITTSSLDPDDVNSDYSATIQATGGVQPYEWDLTVDAGLTDLFLHTYTGKLSGKLNKERGRNNLNK